MSEQTMPVRIAVVGCGAAAELLHLPALARRDDCEVVAVVDPDRGRAEQVARRFGVQRVLADHRHLADAGATAAIVAAPNDLHAALTMDLVGLGLDVLVEKPVALTVDDADAMAAAAEHADAVVGVGMLLRFAAANRTAKALIDQGVVGVIRSFTIDAGVEYAWPVSTAYVLDRARAGGGALIDIGTHALDLMRWWLGDVAEFSYRDDSHGGVEADSLIEVTLHSGASGVVELSRTRELGHRATLHGERGVLDIGTVDGSLSLALPDGSRVDGFAADGGVAGDLVELTAAEHDDFLDAVRRRRCPETSLQDGRATLDLVVACYRERQPWDLPWVRPPREAP